MAIPVEINAVAAPLDEASDDELFRVLQNALDFSVSACQFDNDQDGQLACEQYDKSILYIDEILGKLPSHTPQYSKLMQLRFSYDDRMEFLKNFDNMKLESTSTKMKGNDKKRVNQRSFEEDERLLNFNAGHSVLGSNLFEQQPALPSSVPFWRMRQIQRSISNGSFLSPNVFVPAGVWTQKGVKLCGLSIKSSAFQEVLAIIKEIDYPTAAYEHEAPTQSLLVLLSSLRIAYEEMAAIQNQLSKPFLFIQEIVQDDTTKPTSKGQVALSRFTSIVATFGKSVINFAEVGYQRLGTMATKISEEDFATYTTLLSHTCESCQVFEKIRMCVEEESNKLTGNYEGIFQRKSDAEVRHDSVLLARALREFDDVSADTDSNSTGASSNHINSPSSDDIISNSADDAKSKNIDQPCSSDVTSEGTCDPSEDEMERWIVLQDLSFVLSNISNFMKDVVCEVFLRDTEVLTLRHILKTRKNFSRMYWDDEQSYKDENQGLTDF